MSKPKRQISLGQSRVVDYFRGLTNDEHDGDHEHTGAKEPVGDVNDLGTTMRYGHPHVYTERNHDRTDEQQVYRTDVFGIFATGGDARPQQDQAQAQTDVPIKGGPQAELF